MHDPSFLLFHVRPIRLDVWHDEPGGRDAGTVCGYGPAKHGEISLARLRWAWQHRDHLHYRFWPYLRIKNWLTLRCDHCGNRFRWKRDSRHSYMNSDKVWHGPCMAYLTWRRRCDEAYDYIVDRDAMDHTARWRVEYNTRERCARDVG